MPIATNPSHPQPQHFYHVQQQPQQFITHLNTNPLAQPIPPQYPLMQTVQQQYPSMQPIPPQYTLTQPIPPQYTLTQPVQQQFPPPQQTFQNPNSRIQNGSYMDANGVVFKVVNGQARPIYTQKQNR